MFEILGGGIKVLKEYGPTLVVGPLARTISFGYKYINPQFLV